MPRSIIASLPNIVSVARAALSVPICYLLIEGSPRSIWLALGFFGLAAASDLVDGSIARAFNATSTLGSHLDPLADKILVGAPLAVIAMTANYTSFAPMVLALAIFCSVEVPMACTRVRLLLRRHALHASQNAKWKTLAEYLGLALVVVGLAPVPLREILQVAGFLTITLASGYAWRSRNKDNPLDLR